MGRLITIKELSGFLQISSKTIYNLVSKKRIPHVRAGGSLRFIQADIELWLKSRNKSKGDR